VCARFQAVYILCVASVRKVTGARGRCQELLYIIDTKRLFAMLKGHEKASYVYAYSIDFFAASRYFFFESQSAPDCTCIDDR